MFSINNIEKEEFLIQILIKPFVYNFSNLFISQGISLHASRANLPINPAYHSSLLKVDNVLNPKLLVR